MKKFSKAAKQKARDFLLTQARPLEQALYRYEFEQGDKETVLEELGEFQNPDGGFGHALEPDFRAEQSSALATSVALDILRDLDISAENPLVSRSIAYLLESYNPETGVWRIIPEGTDASPHAPWWSQERLETTFDGFRWNPKAELAGYLWTYESLVPVELKNAVLDSAVQAIEAPLESIGGDALLCYTRLIATKNLPADIQRRIRNSLQELIPVSVELDPEKWGDYCLKPLWLVNSPASPFYETLAEAVESNLDYEIESQCQDGSWTPNWNWAGTFPEAWKQAEREWRGILTLRNLRSMKNFGRLEFL